MASIQPLNFPHLLKRFRRAAGLTQEELAARAGLSVEGISALERGVNRSPRRETVELLAQALHLSPRDQSLFEAAARGRLAQTPQMPQSNTPLPPVLGTPPLFPLVGRSRELGVVERHLAPTGLGGALLVAGEPGIGKSRLLQEATRMAAAAGLRVMVGGCTRRSGQEPYSPVLETIAGFLRTRTPAQVRSDLEGCAWLVRLLPELAEQAVVPAPSWTLPPEQERRLMFAAVQRFLANAAGPAGTLLVLDDLQWAGADALDLLAALLESPAPLEGEGRTLPRVVGAYRSTEVTAQDPLGALLADLASRGMATQLALGPLESDASAALLDALLTSRAAPDWQESSSDIPDQAVLFDDLDLRERVLTRAEGVPFFLVSSVLGLRTGTVSISGRQKIDTTPRRDRVETVPWDVAQSIRRRVVALSEPAQLLLGIAAVAGRSTTRADLLAAARATDPQLADEHAALAALETTIQAGLLVESGDEACAFAHDLIREVVLGDLSAARRAAWHRRLGEALERLAEGMRKRRAAELAWHFLQASEASRALPYVLEAGDQAKVVYAHAEAERHYRAAVDVASAVGDQGSEVRALERLGEVLMTIGRQDEAIAIVERASEHYHAAADTEGMIRTGALLAQAHAFKGTVEEGIRRVLPLLEAASMQRSAPRSLCTLYVGLAGLYYVGARYRDLLEASERAAELADAVQDRQIGGRARMMEGSALVLLGRAQEGEQTLGQAIAQLEEAQDLTTLWLALNFRSGVYEHWGRLEQCRRDVDRALHIAELIDDPTGTANMLCRRGSIAFHQGEWGRPRADYERANALIRQLGVSTVSAFPPLCLGELCLATGRVDEGWTYLNEASTAAWQNGLAPFYWAAQRLLLEHDLLRASAEGLHARVSELEQHLAPAVADTTEIVPMLAWAYIELGDLTRAEGVATMAVAQAREHQQRKILTDALRIQALLALRRAEWDAAERSLHEALALCRAMPYPWAEAKALYVYGLLHEAKGEPVHARGQFEAALAICERLGEGLYRPHIKRALAHLARE